MSDTSYPFRHPATHVDWMPEIDPIMAANLAPEGYPGRIVTVPQPYDGSTRVLGDPRLTESDLRDQLTPEQQAALLAEVTRSPRQLLDEQLAGRTAENELKADQERRLRAMGLPANSDEPMGPDLDTPHF